MVIQVGLVFLLGEKEGDYNQAIDQLRNIIAIHTIQELTSIVIDRELALIRCLSTRFPYSYHILCRQHVNMNVLAKTKRFFLGLIRDSDSRVTRHPSFQEFLSSWNALLASSTKEAYNQQLQSMRDKYPAGAMSYCEGTWLLQKENLVAYQIQKHFHFRVTVTSPIEGCHAVLKLYLQRGHGDLRDVFKKMKLF